ncbi:MAG: hypothetical protein F6K65_17560 [Moorea sp. SIO3C2]|nr:hypothetical protein [Moorena sp. SIO3C2]
MWGLAVGLAIAFSGSFASSRSVAVGQSLLAEAEAFGHALRSLHRITNKVVRYGTGCSNHRYRENEGEPVPNTPYATLAYCLLPIAYCLLPYLAEIENYYYKDLINLSEY